MSALRRTVGRTCDGICLREGGSIPDVSADTVRPFVAWSVTVRVLLGRSLGLRGWK